MNKKIKFSLNLFILGLTIMPFISVCAENQNSSLIYANENISYTDTDKDNTISFGDEVCIGEECFYVVGHENNKIEMFAKYNLYVNQNFYSGDDPYYVDIDKSDEKYGKQSDITLIKTPTFPTYGVIRFVDFSQHDKYTYEDSLVKPYVNDYSNYLLSEYNVKNEASLPSYDFLKSLGFKENSYYDGEYSWLVNTRYWTDTVIEEEINVYPDGSYYDYYNYVIDNGRLIKIDGTTGWLYGIRPIVTIDDSLLKQYNLVIDKVQNGKVEYSVSNNEITLNIKPDKGYEIDKITVLDSNNNEITVVNNKFTMPASDVNVKVTFKAIDYNFIEGENSTYQDNDLVFKLDGEYDLVDKVLINGEVLNPQYYTIEKGSTILTIKDEYLKNLKSGTYNLTVVYSNGTEKTTTFKVDKSSKDNNIKEDNVLENPKTSDNIFLYIISLVFGMIGLIVSSIKLKKANNN